MRKVLRENGLSIVFGLLFLLALVGQAVAGQYAYNEDQQEHGKPTLGFVSYLKSSHFGEALTENWESEFLQMFAFVVLTAYLFQKGSAESKELDEEPAVDPEPGDYSKEKDAPWPVKKGGLVLKFYEYSLSLTFLLLFLASFTLHAISGAKEYNETQREHGSAEVVSTLEYMRSSRFWFESLQNWQSEFLAVGAMVVLSIFLRQKGSPESKPVDSPHGETGGE